MASTYPTISKPPFTVKMAEESFFSHPACTCTNACNIIMPPPPSVEVRNHKKQKVDRRFITSLVESKKKNLCPGLLHLQVLITYMQYAKQRELIIVMHLSMKIEDTDFDLNSYSSTLSSRIYNVFKVTIQQSVRRFDGYFHKV